MPSIDTNILLRMILGDVYEQRQMILRLTEKHDVLSVSDLAISEMVYVLEKSQKVSRKLINELVSSLIANQHLNINRPLFERVIPLYEKHNGASFNDCCLAVYAKLDGTTPVYTFDKKIARDLPYVELLK